MINDQWRVPTIFIVLGATGDLMRRKILPALLNLFQKKSLPTKFQVIGFSRRELSDVDFRKHAVKQLSGEQISGSSGRELAEFLSHFSYCHGDLRNPQDYQCIAGAVASVDSEWRVCSNKLFYLAIPPELYKLTFTNLAKSGLTKPCGPDEGWTRVLVEKPFGKNFKTAVELDALLGKLFKEVQVYRIDHYLAKEMVQNILNFRFSNNLFEPLWNNQYIEKINIRLWETIGVEHRGEFYDGLGALRDVGQNHLLQMLALIAMENPGSFDPDAIRAKRAELLSQLHIPTRKEISQTTFRAQHLGYGAIAGVKPNSNTETYFAIKCFLDSSRWKGVPIYLEGGKRLGQVRKEVVITLRHPVPCLLCPPGTSEHYKNQIQIAMEPQEAIRVYFWLKKPGARHGIERRAFDFLLREKEKKAQYIEEYGQLLLEAVVGDQILFVSTEEVTAMWKFIDPIVRAWEKNIIPLARYKPDTLEPVEAAKYIELEPARPRLAQEMGIVGLGKMGANIARRLRKRGWRVIGYDVDSKTRKILAGEGITVVTSLENLTAKLSPPRKRARPPRGFSPRILWVMTPSGKPTEQVIFGKDGLVKFLQKGDIIIDGGNSFYKDSVRRFRVLQKKGIHFVDVGVSGGPEGALHGASLMIGGEEKTFRYLEPFFQDLATANGYQFFQGAGAGHFVKMIHNGIEYGMMQAIAEGFTILKNTKYKLDLKKVADVYNHGSVIESRLVGWLKKAFQVHGQDLKKVSGLVGHTGEGEWTVKTAKAIGIKTKIIEGALKFRKESAKNPSYTGKVLTALRNRFGGHGIAELRRTIRKTTQNRFSA